MCEWKPDFERLDERITKLEEAQDAIRSAQLSGFANVNANITALSQQMANLDKRIIEEKQRWGETLRNIVTWGARTLFVVTAVACGVGVGGKLITLIFG